MSKENKVREVNLPIIVQIKSRIETWIFLFLTKDLSKFNEVWEVDCSIIVEISNQAFSESYLEISNSDVAIFQRFSV